jgi:FkbM family methyltransferase
MIKPLIKNLLGPKLILRLRLIQEKVAPNKVQKERLELELGEIKRRKAFYGSFIQKNDLCFDVGANVGNRIGPLLKIGAKVVAIEPQESCYTLLKNKFGNRIELVTNGLGESESVKDFHISNASTISSFSDEWIDSVKNGRFKEYNWDNVVKIQMTTLDKLIQKYGTPVFIKIDVEGYELNVLKGLTKPVRIISFEYTVPEQTNKVVECIEAIEKNGSNVECNYSVGEGMTFALQDWLSVEDMRKHIFQQEFIDTGFGDVYVRLKSE